MEQRLRQQLLLGLMISLQMHCEVLDSIRKQHWKSKEQMVMKPWLLKRSLRKQRQNSKCIRPVIFHIGLIRIPSFKSLKVDWAHLNTHDTIWTVLDDDYIIVKVLYVHTRVLSNINTPLYLFIMLLLLMTSSFYISWSYVFMDKHALVT